MRRKLMLMMLILGCFLLPGSCHLTSNEMNVHADIFSGQEQIVSGYKAEIYDTASGRRVMVLPAEELFSGKNHELNNMMQRNAYLRIILYHP